ncbi:MAG: hypothetical protein KGH71_06320, partial [Candidatus Micrarchaeota archaeon]|nr:hypothetical protein [Candidatus Micrarchaeota archaeon]
MKGKKLLTNAGEISYSVVRERRKSVSLRFNNSELIIAIPRYSLVDVDKLIRDHMSWIVKHYIEISNSKNLLEGDSILMNGVYHPIEFLEKPG